MIRFLALKNFKCFENHLLPFNNLTLLSGINSSGKSSILQALCLLRSTFIAHKNSEALILNHKPFDLGNVRDIMNTSNRNQASFEIQLVSEKEDNILWEFSPENRESAFAPIQSIAINHETFEQPKDLSYLLPRDIYEKEEEIKSFIHMIRDLVYISAERIAPKDIYECLADPHIDVGTKGELTISRFYQCSFPVQKKIMNWMRKIFPGLDLDLFKIPSSHSIILRIKTHDEGASYRSLHVGFGITQVLPIVVALVSAEKGSLLLFENPEVHIHPKAQSILAQLCAEKAEEGVQIIIETHSDHILNGIRRSVKDKKLDNNKVSLLFFRDPKHKDENEDQVVQPGIDEEGNIDNWVENFFDQFDKDIDYFTGWSD